MTDAIFWCLLAQADADPVRSPFANMQFVFLGILILMYFLLIRPDRQKQKTHRTAVENLKKNDRVVTIGGIYGVVTNIQRESDEVTLKVDETTNTKLRVTLGAIGRVLGDEPAAEKPDKS